VTLPVAGAFVRRIEVEEAVLGRALGERDAAEAHRTERLMPFMYLRPVSASWRREPLAPRPVLASLPVGVLREL